MRLSIEVSPGEAADKLTILRIKQDRIRDPAKLAHIGREAEMLEAALAPLRQRFPAILPLIEELRRVNEALWDVEDALRLHEKRGDFGDEFVRLARSVYVTNDRRAAVKAEINRILGSDIAEQKSYA
ncbi:MAG: DUF6165 family protein [Elioraea tepidiphila]